MLTSQSASFSGKKTEAGFSGFFANEKVFFILVVDEGILWADGEKLFLRFQQDLLTQKITSLSEFESVVSNLIVKLNFPAHFHMACGVLYNDVLYVKTVGKGQVYFRRGNEFNLLMDGDKSASGFVKEYDLAVFTTTKITELVGAVADIKVFADMDTPRGISEKMQNEGYADEDKGFVGLFVEFLQEGSVVTQPHQEVAPQMIGNLPVMGQTNSAVPPEMVINPSIPVTETVQAPSVEPVVQPPVQSPNVPLMSTEVMEPEPKKRFSIPFFSHVKLRQSKGLTFVVVALLFAVLLWSVVFGYQRRAAAELQKKVDTAKTEITSDLQKAEEEAFLNVDQSMDLISSAKGKYETLKKEVGDKKTADLTAIQKKIEETESKIVKREEKESVEFYDLALEEENAKGEALYLENDSVAILDRANETVYLLTLDKKSITKYVAPEVAQASLVSLYNGNVFFFSATKGIYEFTTETKAKQIIAKDSDWGKIMDMEIYNGNIYLLDSGNDEIYKYLVATGGYSDKSSYFAEGSAVNLSDATDMTIDSAVYIALKGGVTKYISGGADTFETEFPEKSPNLTGIYTNADIENVYVWDKTAGTVYELKKDGEYGRQVAAGVIRRATGFFVYDNKSFILDGKKLYMIALD